MSDDDQISAPASGLPDRARAIGFRDNLPVTDDQALIEAEVDVSRPGPHDLLVEVAAVSVNPIDVKTRASADASEAPGGLRILGFDAAGTVRAVGDQVTLFAPGDEVYYAGSSGRPGTDQRFHAVDERIVGRKPQNLSMADAASLPLTSITAWECLLERLRLTADSTGTLLVVGATGGVGAMALQIAEQLLPQVTVIATASSDDRADFVRDLGAEHTVDHHGDLAAQVLDLVPDGVDWIFTSHSADQLDIYGQIVRPFGEIVAIDDGSRDVKPLKPRCLAWHWELMFTRAQLGTDDMITHHQILDRIAELVETGHLRPVVQQVLSPISADTLRQAHELVESNRTLGKVVVAGWE